MNNSDLETGHSSAHENLLCSKDAANYLGISISTLSRIKKAKKIAYYKVAGRILYSCERHLRDFLDSVEQPTDPSQ